MTTEQKNNVPFGCYYIDREYIQYLHDHGDEHVPRSDYEDEDRCRKFYCGPVFNEDGLNYFVPVSSKVREMRLNNIETYGVTLQDANREYIGCLDFRYMIPCYDNELLTPYEPHSHGAKQATACMEIQNKICKEAKATYNNIISRDYEFLNRTAIDYDKVIDAVWEFDDMRMARRMAALDALASQINDSVPTPDDKTFGT